MKRVLPDLFGRHVLQVGNWGRGQQLLESSEMLHRAVLGTVDGLGASARAAPERLPVAERSVDACVLPHTLEFSTSPYSVLREANRILSDRGRLVVLGFSPLNPWSMRQRVGLGLRYRAFPEGARFVGVRMLSDWLDLLDFEVTEVRRYGVSSPWPEAYVLVAKKRVIPMTLVGRVQRSAVRPILGGVATPSQSRTPHATE